MSVAVPEAPISPFLLWACFARLPLKQCVGKRVWFRCIGTGGENCPPCFLRFPRASRPTLTAAPQIPVHDAQTKRNQNNQKLESAKMMKLKVPAVKICLKEKSGQAKEGFTFACEFFSETPLNANHNQGCDSTQLDACTAPITTSWNGSFTLKKRQ
ncbi:MAG: hypothetical protein ABSG33_10550 [Candidatus Bathyarchaeia archaeon]